MARRFRVTTWQPGYAMRLVDAVEKAGPDDTISVNSQTLTNMVAFKADQLAKAVNVIVEEEAPEDG